MKIHDEGFFLIFKEFWREIQNLIYSIERLWFDKRSFKVF